MIFKKPHGAAAIELELTKLESRRTALQGKLAGAEAALEQARAEQREFLITDDGDDAKDRSKIDARLNECERDADSLRDVLAEIERRLTDTRKRLAEARDSELRETAASDRESSANAVEKAALQLERSVEALATAFENLAAVIPDDSGARIYEYLMGPRQATPVEAARAILASGLFNRCSDIFLVEGPPVGFYVSILLPVCMRRPDGALDRNILKNDDSVEFRPASGSADEIIVKPLRDAAAGLRAGTHALPAPKKAAPPAVIEPAPFEMVRIIFTKPCVWRNERGAIARSQDPENYRQIHVFHFVEEPVADAAITAGAAVLDGGEEAERLRHTSYVPRRRRIPESEYLTLNVEWPPR